jgi:predicted site-specific integrase-resolvase
MIDSYPRELAVYKHDNSQKPDLSRQIEFLVSRYPGCEVIRDVGSGLKFKKKGLLTLLERVLSGDIGMVVIANSY